MMPYGWHDGGWGVAWMLLSWVVVVSIIWWIFAAMSRASGPDRHAAPRDPREILDERFAKGEIDAQEYRERQGILDEGARTASDPESRTERSL